MEKPLEVEDRCRREQKGNSLVGDVSGRDKNSGRMGGEVEKGLNQELKANPFLVKPSDTKTVPAGTFQFKANTESKDPQPLQDSKKVGNVLEPELNKVPEVNPFLSKPEKKIVPTGAFQFKANTESKDPQPSQNSKKIGSVLESELKKEPEVNPFLSKPPENKKFTTDTFQFKANTDSKIPQPSHEYKKSGNAYKSDSNQETTLNSLLSKLEENTRDPTNVFQYKASTDSDNSKIPRVNPQTSKVIRREKQIIKEKVKETEKIKFTGFELPSNIINSPKTDQGGLFQHPEPFNFGPTPMKEGSESPEYLKKNLNFFLSPIEQPGFASPFNIDSNFQTPNMPKYISQVNTEETKQKQESILKKLSEKVYEDLLESFFLSESFIEFVAENSVQKVEKDVKFFINDVSKQETQAINELKRQVTIKKHELEEKKKRNKVLTQEYEKTESDMKRTLEKFEKFRLKYSKYERLIKRSSKHYSQILMPEFEDKEKELSMLGGNRNNLSKILERLKEENLEYSRRIENKKRSLTDKKNKNSEFVEAINKFDELNQSLRDEMKGMKPKKNEISLQYGWVKYKKESKNKKFKSYEEEIEKVQKEIEELKEGIVLCKRRSEVGSNELDLLEEEIKRRIKPRVKKEVNYGKFSQESLTKDISKPEKETGMEKVITIKVESGSGGTKEDLINLLAFLIIIFTIIVIFK